MEATNKTLEIPRFLKRRRTDKDWETIACWARKFNVKKRRYEQYMEMLGYLNLTKDPKMKKAVYRLTSKGLLHSRTVTGFIGEKNLWDYESFSEVARLGLEEAKMCCHYAKHTTCFRRKFKEKIILEDGRKGKLLCATDEWIGGSKGISTWYGYYIEDDRIVKYECHQDMFCEGGEILWNVDKKPVEYWGLSDLDN